VSTEAIEAIIATVAPTLVVERRSSSGTSPITGTVERFLRHLRVERGLARATVEAYRRDLTRYAGYLEERGIGALDDVRPEDVEAFVGWLRDLQRADARPLAARTVTRTVVAVRGLHRYLRAEEGAASDPAASVAAPATGRSLPKALSVEEVLALLAAPTGDAPATLRDRVALELLYGAGLRISELVGADLDDVDPVERLISVRGKGDRQRIVPFGEPAAEAIDAWLVRGRPVTGPRSPALLVNLRGGRLSRQGLWKVLHAHASAVGLDGRMTPHTLRHSYATHLLDGGADVRTVQELLGHASVTTTQIYTLVSRTALRSVYARAHPRA
jgi:integrase/recombinase XerD